MKDSKLLAYYLHQLKQEVNIGSQRALLLFFKTQSSKERQHIAEYFLASSDPQVQMFAISSYVAFTKKEEQHAMYNKALSSDITNKKGVALGLYYSFLNKWIREAPTIGKYFIDYLHELTRRKNWSRGKITKENFIKNIKLNHPIIRMHWK